MPWRGGREQGEYPSLGHEVLRWSEQLPSPRNHEEPLRFTDEQARVVLQWFRLDPKTGEFVYRRACQRRAKGWGKSPVQAVLAIAELAGPVRFDGWDAAGEPVGRPWGTKGDPRAWVQIAAVSEDQTENTHSVVYELLTANDGKPADALKIDVGLSRCYLADGQRTGKLEPVTASAGSREGQPITYGTLDETYLWTSHNGGVRLAATMRRNATKMNARIFETTNSFEPGNGSVAESTHKAFERGFKGIFYDQVEAPQLDIEKATDEELLAALKVAYGDSWWVDLPRVVADIHDPAMLKEDAERFFFNWNRAGESRAVDSKQWDALKTELEVPAGAYIGLGFEGSSAKVAVLRGCTPAGYSFDVQTWTAPTHGDKDWTVPRAQVDEAVERAFQTYQVGLMLCDPPKWQTEIESWAARWGEKRVLAFDTDKPVRMAPAVDRWLTAIREGSHAHDGNEVVTSHVQAAHLRKVGQDPDDESRTRYVLVRGDGSSRIDAVRADVLAYEAAMTMPEALVSVYEDFSEAEWGEGDNEVGPA